jgi:hypothetical protein
LKADQTHRSSPSECKQVALPAKYTPEPWSILRDESENAWIVVGESQARGRTQIARIADAPSVEECQANAYLIAQAPAMHRAAVRLMCLWGTEDAQEAMEELAEILSRAVRTENI